MELKKSKKADLERNRSSFFQIGLVLALSTALFAFEWKSSPKDIETGNNYYSGIFEPEPLPLATVREEIKPIQQNLTPIIELIPNDVDFDPGIVFIPTEIMPWDPFNSMNPQDGPESIIEDSAPWVTVEDMPTFNGGKPEIEFRKYISQNLNYPQIAVENMVSGKVYVQFIIDPNGRLTDAKVINPIDPALDKEALRVINSSPLWVPGKQRNKPVKVIFTFPINFVLK